MLVDVYLELVYLETALMPSVVWVSLEVTVDLLLTPHQRWV